MTFMIFGYDSKSLSILQLCKKKLPFPINEKHYDRR